MKLECPHCFQHYEISKKDKNSLFHCVNCEQAFLGSQANVIKDNTSSKLRILTNILAFIIVIFLIIILCFLWRLEGRIANLEAKNCTVSTF